MGMCSFVEDHIKYDFAFDEIIFLFVLQVHCFELMNIKYLYSLVFSALINALICLPTLVLECMACTGIAMPIRIANTLKPIPIT